ncbi:MAG: DNA/RNA non-specific endonuclease [Phenylobacterium sp.]|uniref:DNA/RNA non-specific endonuclease n=1 Tax=Phenylobacterium sp. TaxID=1871053 RepID=UPI00271B6775|nr:DNA/RNA non-specific endonuclease [Phenylobacterium sp.]MDO8410168.1 DNA/RNA non-specific endonuclease [Phenylobacterium sp.]
MSTNDYSFVQPGIQNSSAYLIYPSPLDYIRQLLKRPSPPSIPTIEIGDALFYAVDTGYSTALVPLQEVRPWSPSDDARRRRDAERFTTQTHATIGSGLYGVAKLLGASDGLADSVLGIGSIADIALGSARFGGVVRTPRAPPRRVASPTQQQPAVRFGLPKASGQATRTNSTVTSKQVGAGSEAARSIKPPGWQKPLPDKPRHDQERGHLLANVLGGTGKDPRNLVTIPKKTNRYMWEFEKIVRDRAKLGEVVKYHVQPLYDGPGQSPSIILMTATGSRGLQMSRVIVVKKPNQP